MRLLTGISKIYSYYTNTNVLQKSIAHLYENTPPPALGRRGASSGRGCGVGSAGEVVETNDAKRTAADFESGELVGLFSAEGGSTHDLLVHVLL